MLDYIENHLKTLNNREIYMIAISMICFIGFIFYQYVYISFENENNFYLLQKEQISRKANGVKKLIKNKSIETIKTENKQIKHHIENMSKQIENIDAILNNINKFNIKFMPTIKSTSINENNITTILLMGTLPKLLEDIDSINQRFKIIYFKLQTNKESSMDAKITTNGYISNKSRKDILLSLESPFFNVHNIFNITSIIGNIARINNKWYRKDDNITSLIKVYKITKDTVSTKDSKGVIKIFPFNK